MGGSLFDFYFGVLIYSCDLCFELNSLLNLKGRVRNDAISQFDIYD